MTKAHRDPFEGYGMRVSANMPKNAAPLAYVYAEKATPARNVSVENQARLIRENRTESRSVEKKGSVSEGNRFIDESGSRLLATEDVDVTDEFSSAGHPLFYRYTLRERFDARGAKVAVTRNGFERRPDQKRFEELSYGEQEDLLYLGENIRLYENGQEVSPKEYKVKMTRNGQEGFLFDVHMYVRSRGSEDAPLEVRYRGFKEGRSVERMESVNARPFFQRVSKTSVDSGGAEGQRLKQYAIEKEGEGYALYVAAESIVIDERNRPSHRFQYQVEGRLSGRLSKSNPMSMNVGFAYINDTAFGPEVRNLTGVGKRLFSESNDFLPSGLRLNNPHPADNHAGRESTRYWLVNLDMPESHYLEYDLLVISGYGRRDMTRHQGAIRAFLEKGGRLIVDNAGEDGNVLDFVSSNRQTFIRNVLFSKTIKQTGQKQYGAGLNAMRSRYFVLSAPNAIGSVAPQLQFGDGESASSWSTLVSHGGVPNIVMANEGKGQLIVSAEGLCRDVAENKEEGLMLFSNLLVWAAEERVVRGPLLRETVHHRNTLFETEYTQRVGRPYYVDGRALDDPTQIVARKVLAPRVKDAIPVLPEGFETAEGTYEVKVNAENGYPLENAGFEAKRIEDADQWTATTLDALPGWDAILFAGSGTMSRTTQVSYRGESGGRIQTTGGHLFFQKRLGLVPAGRYEIEAWLLTESVSGAGARIGIYRPDGTMVATSQSLTGTRQWTRVRLIVEQPEQRELMLRIGFINGNGVGTIGIDNVSMKGLGEVRVTPVSDGEAPLYAYASASRGEGLDVSNLGMDVMDAVIDEPVHPIRFTVRPYVYAWTTVDGLPLYQRRYGEAVEHRFNISAAEGLKVLERFSVLLPPLGEGALWADKNAVYYEIEVYEQEGSESLNLSLYDPERGQYFYAIDGRIVVNHFAMFGERLTPLTVLQAKSNYRTIRATKRLVGVHERRASVIEVLPPASNENRESWFLRIRNGAFLKEEWNGREMEILSTLSNRETLLSRMVGRLSYALPEYARQSFYPRFGEQLREEYAEYIDERLIRVSRRPVVLYERDVVRQELDATDTERTRFTDGMGRWRRNQPVEVYIDEGNGPVRVMTGFSVDHLLGVVQFNGPRTGSVYASFRQDNFQVVRRRYTNENVERERLVSGDGFVFSGSKENWLTSPTPVIFGDDGRAVPPERYSIDEQAGTVTSKLQVRGNLFATYRYFEEEELEVEDVNVMTGQIRLSRNITFKDEVYVRYVHEEPFYVYKGYWDMTSRTFVRLDLNPTPGHLITIRDEEDGVARYRDVPSRQLLNKDIHLYLLPEREEKGNSLRTETECVRHTLTKEEWDAVKAARPEALLIGRIQVREHTNIENVVVMDARRRGGGLREDIGREDIERVGGNAESFWDIGEFDGDAYFEKGVIVVRVPQGVLREHGGEMTEADVETVVKRHVAYGVHIIIEYV